MHDSPIFDKDAQFKSTLIAELMRIGANLESINGHLQSIAESLSKIEQRDASKPRPV